MKSTWKPENRQRKKRTKIRNQKIWWNSCCSIKNLPYTNQAKLHSAPKIPWRNHEKYEVTFTEKFLVIQNTLINGFKADVCQKFQFFLSHKVLSTFLNNNRMNDESNHLKMSMKSVYVPRWAWMHQSIVPLAWKDIKHQTHTIFAPNYQLWDMDTIMQYLL